MYSEQENSITTEDEPPPEEDEPPDLKTHKTINSLSKFFNEDVSSYKNIINIYHMSIPEYYLSLIQNPLDKNDPIRKQCIPSLEELDNNIDMDIDPLGEEIASPTRCLVHRYPDRVLLLVTGRCFMYCRHCTRKRLWNKDCIDPSIQEIMKAIDYIRNNSNIREVIISGGDPLILSIERLDYILSLLSDISHIDVIRIGTRTPVVFPERICDILCDVLSKYNVWINIQFNHPREITSESMSACRKLQRVGIPLSNQSVLLKGINDDASIMIELCHLLQKNRIRPYYLFQCDPVVGASHFRTSIYKGIEIMEAMRGHTSGMCIPTFVIDGPDGKGKIPLLPNYLLSATPDKVILRNYQFKNFEYINP